MRVVWLPRQPEFRFVRLTSIGNLSNLVAMEQEFCFGHCKFPIMGVLSSLVARVTRLKSSGSQEYSICVALIVITR